MKHSPALLWLFLFALTLLGGAAEPVVGPAKGALVIVGGGGKSGAIFERFIELAGGAQSRIVVVPTAEEGEPLDVEHCPGYAIMKRAGAGHVAMLHTRDRKVADSEEFIAPLKEATGVWLGGGRQWRFADAYLGTRTQKEMFAVLARGGAIGGSSAGATIQGSFLVRGSPLGNQIMVAPDHLEGFGFLRNCAIDQHVLVRRREWDLVPVIQERPDLLGIGLDEDTAIVVRGDRCEVIGASKALFYDARRWPMADGAAPWLALRAGQQFDLARREIFEASAKDGDMR